MTRNTKLLLFSAFGLFAVPSALAQNVGIGTPTPATKLNVVQNANVTGIQVELSGTAGNSLLTVPTNAGNLSSTIFTPNFSSGIGFNLNMLNAASVADGIQIVMDGTGAGQSIFHDNTGVGQFINMSVAGNGLSGQQIDHVGAGNGSWVFHSGAGNGYRVNHSGAGIGMLVDHTGTGIGSVNIMDANSISHVNDLLSAGGTGTLTVMDGNDGDGYVFTNVDNALAPTTGGDGFGFDAVVNTQTATGGGIINGGLFAGTQWGIGHGMIITHSGATGRGMEVNLEAATNAESNYFGVNNGTGSVFVGQNQNNAIAGTITVADFAYTGTDVDDHVAVSGFSAPAAGWGIGVQGTGNWFGVLSFGDMGATGVKPFTIDHPADPENKILKHFAIESNEVLNMYRGVVELDANGEAIVELPDYFEMININFSYQLTAIGTPQQPYVLTEIQGNQFAVAGAPNSKVSWTVYADRNDPYLQQNPEKGIDVVDKTGSRQGKYLTPELYGKPASSGMFYNPNIENGGAEKNTAPVPNGVNQYTPPSNSGQIRHSKPKVEEPVIE